MEPSPLIAGRRRVVLGDEAFDAFAAALDVPVGNPALRTVLAEPSPFESR